MGVTAGDIWDLWGILEMKEPEFVQGPFFIPLYFTPTSYYQLIIIHRLSDYEQQLKNISFTYQCH